MAMQIHTMDQGSDEWYTVRAGLPTASEFGKIVTGTGKASTQIADYAAILAAELFAGKPLDRWEGNGATERGHELEPLARANYEFERDVEIVTAGFVTNHDAGCSPDGLIGSDGLTEFKCQLAKGHVQTLAYWHKHRKCPPAYYPQVQGQLLICEREWDDLNFFHPDLPPLVIRVTRDEAYIRELLRGIRAVNEERDRLVEILRAS